MHTEPLGVRREGPSRDVAIIAGSAGSIEPLQEIVRGLGGYRGTVLVVVHVAPDAPSALPSVLGRLGTLPARHAVEGDPLTAGTLLVAPPDRHLLVDGDHLVLGRGPHVNGTRPAADPLFESAAQALGPRVAGVVLSGALDDGARGLAAVKSRGGVAIVQRPEEARFAGMPRSAVSRVDVDFILNAREISTLLKELALASARTGPPLAASSRGRRWDPTRQ